MVMTQPAKVSFTCSICREQVEIDISGFHPRISINDFCLCNNNHKTSVTIRGGKIIFKNTRVESDIVEYARVPDHLKEITKEAYVCMTEKVSKAGACMVRLMLDGLLWEIGFKDGFLGRKLNNFERKCKSDISFASNNKTIYDRIAIFRTISQLAGYHAHAQSGFLRVNPTEFEQYLHAVEGAIKDKWSK